MWGTKQSYKILSLRRMHINPSDEISVNKCRQINSSESPPFLITLRPLYLSENKWVRMTCDGVFFGIDTRWLFGEHAEMVFQILLSNGTFNVNVPYVWLLAVSPLSDGVNGAASPFNDEVDWIRRRRRKQTVRNTYKKLIKQSKQKITVKYTILNSYRTFIIRLVWRFCLVVVSDSVHDIHFSSNVFYYFKGVFSSFLTI